VDSAKFNVAGGEAHENGICGAAQDTEHNTGKSHTNEGANDEGCSGGLVEACEFVAVKFFNDKAKDPGT